MSMQDRLLHPADQEQGRWRSLVVAEPVGARPGPAKPTTRAAPLWPFVLGAILFSVLSAVSRKSVYDSFGTRYTFFRQQWTNLLYNLYATAILVAQPHRLRSRRRFPAWKFLPAALLDSLADFLTSVGGPGTPGEWTVLLGQSTIFCTMVFSALLLRRRYRCAQLLGAVAVVAGGSLAVLPRLFLGGGLGGGCGCVLVSVAIFFSGDVPSSLSATYKDWAFKSAALDVFYLTACVSWTQLALTWCWLPLQTLPAFGGVDLAELGPGLAAGFRCFLGDAAVPIYGAATVAASAGGGAAVAHAATAHVVVGHCSAATPLITMVFSLSGFIAGVCQLVILKRGSAVYAACASAVALPLSAFAFAWEPLVGAALYKPLTGWGVGGAALVLAGLALYTRGMPAVTVRANDEGAAEEAVLAWRAFLGSDDSAGAARAGTGGKTGGKRGGGEVRIGIGDAHYDEFAAGLLAQQRRLRDSDSGDSDRAAAAALLAQLSQPGLRAAPGSARRQTSV